MMPAASPVSPVAVRLAVEELRATPDSRLLTYLMNVHDSVRALSLTGGPSRSSAAQRVSPFTASYVTELLTPRLLSSAIPDVSQLVACLLCDAVRLHAEEEAAHDRQRQRQRLSPLRHRDLSAGELAPQRSDSIPMSSGSGASGTYSSDADERDARGMAGLLSLPFPRERCRDVLRCIGDCFAALVDASPPHPLQRVAYVVERAARARVFGHLLPHCALTDPETQACIAHVFAAVRCASSAAAAAAASPPSLSAPGATSAATCAEMADVLRDVLACTHVITPAQLEPLLAELVAASPALRLMTPSTAAQQRAAMSASASSAARSGGALIAARVLLEQMDVLQPAITAWAAAEVDEGLAEVTAADALHSDSEERSEDGNAHAAEADKDDGDDVDDVLAAATMTTAQGEQPRSKGRGRASQAASAALGRKRRGLQVLAHVLGVFVALMELHVDLAQQLLPSLAPCLEHRSAEVRLLALRGFAAAFAASDAAVAAYRAVFVGSFLNRCLDVRPNIRTEAARFSAMLLQQYGSAACETGTAAVTADAPCVVLQRDVWTAYEPCWERLLTDPHVLVRRQAVAAVTEAALAAPRVFAEPGQTPSAFLARTLALRAADKNRRVRVAAVEGLTRLYTTYHLAWIPNSILDGLRVHSALMAASTTAAASAAAGAAAGAGGGAALTAEAVVESLLPAPTGACAAGVNAALSAVAQAPLTRWLSPTPSTAATTSAAAAPVLFDFEKDEEQRQQETRRAFAEGDALLGLGPAAAPTPNPHTASTPVSRFADALVRLCQHLDGPHFTQLLRLYEKKPQLRLTVRRLFEFHAAVKASNGDVKSVEGQQRIHAIHRLLAFLRDTTGALKGEWDALFRAKDDVVRRSLLRACDAAHVDGIDARETLVRALTGRVSADELTFVKRHLAPQLTTAVQPAHVSELLRRLRGCLYHSARREVAVDEDGAVGALRALLLLTAATPAYAAQCTDGLANTLRAAAQLAVGPPPRWCALLLRALQQWATAMSGSTDSQGGGPGSAADVADSLVCTLGDMALAALPMQQTLPRTSGAPAVAGAATTAAAALAALKQSAKQATRTLVALRRVPAYAGRAAAALESLAAALWERLVQRGALTNDVKVVAWLASVKALTRGADGATPLVATLLRVAPATQTRSSADTAAPAPALLTALSSLLRAAVADTSDAAERIPMKALLKACSGEAAAGVAPLQRARSIASAIVDGTAKALVALALCTRSSSSSSSSGSNGRVSAPSSPPSSTCSGVGGSGELVTRASAVAFVTDALLQGYKAVVASAGLTVAGLGACQRRLAVEQQLVKLLLTPTPDTARELAVSVVLSVEEDAQVRQAVQTKLAGHLLHRTCDMRVAALLLLTAISEDSKSSFQRLRSLVETVGDHFRAKQTSQGVSLSSPAALYCYWEYAIPFLVLFLAHHPFYASEEQDNQFVAFQRVWHLLMGELLRHGTQCAGFVVELLSKIKQADDALAPASDACRVMCDLASRVLLECLGQRQSRAEDLRRYPGAVLLPSFFVHTTRANPQVLLETVYLSDSVRVSANAPFRVPTTASGGGHGSRASSRPTPSRASSAAVSLDREDTEEAHTAGSPGTAAATTCSAAAHAGHRRRPRSPSVGVSGAVSLSSPAPSQAHVAVGTDEREAAAAEFAEEEEECGSTPQSRARTEPAVAESASSPEESAPGAVAEGWEAWEAKRAALQHRTIDTALDDLFRGLKKGDIAQLRWKVVRGRLEDALGALERQRRTTECAGRGVDHAGAAGKDVGGRASMTLSLTSEMEELLQYAKDQLRVRYDRAPA